ncbi:MAG TPA: S8 family serine peptidase, partial [Gemmataceae bacterium]|nr:S8 family serine peptidase [Gemmataceae bacterium]
HGTNVAGILGATGSTGTVGVDPNVQIMPVQFMGANGEGSVSNFIQALNFAVQNGAKITNNSWEGAPYSTALYDAFQNAQAHGVISVTAAGNEGNNDDSAPDYPASLSTSLNSVVAVAATTNTNQLASFSNYGPNSVELAAPGVNILGTLPDNQYGDMSGTSMATPEVAGAMALVWGLHPTWTYTQVINQVHNTTQKLPSLQGKVKTGGLLDLAAAVGYSPSISSVPTITSVSSQGLTSTSMDCITLKFNEAINVNSFTASAVTLTAPNGTTIPVIIRTVAGSNDEEIQLWFSSQSAPGNYHLSINSSVRNPQGVAMAPYQTTLALSGSQTYTNSTSTTIAAKGLTMSSIAVPAGANIGNIQVTVNATFPDDSDLYLYLISPTGKTIALDYNRGGTGANLTNTVFSENAGTTIAAGKAPFTGSFLPEGSLSQLNGSSAGGTWRLGIVNSGSVTGKLLNWSLTITPAGSASSTKTTTTPTTSTTKTYTNSEADSIKPNSLTVSSVTAPAGTVSNVEVKLNADYPDDRDLYVYLISPTGKTIALDYNRGGSSADLSNTEFSDQAGTPIADGTAPFSGSYQPEASLSQLNGSSAGGTWRLAIRNYGNNYGTLENWSLILTTT